MRTSGRSVVGCSTAVKAWTEEEFEELAALFADIQSTNDRSEHREFC